MLRQRLTASAPMFLLSWPGSCWVEGEVGEAPCWPLALVPQVALALVLLLSLLRLLHRIFHHDVEVKLLARSPTMPTKILACTRSHPTVVARAEAERDLSCSHVGVSQFFALLSRLFASG